MDEPNIQQPSTNQSPTTDNTSQLKQTIYPGKNSWNWWEKIVATIGFLGLIINIVMATAEIIAVVDEITNKGSYGCVDTLLITTLPMIAIMNIVIFLFLIKRHKTLFYITLIIDLIALGALALPIILSSC